MAKYKLLKRFYFKDGGYAEKGKIVEWTEEHGGCYWWDLDHFGKDFVENNKDFFEEVKEVKICRCHCHVLEGMIKGCDNPNCAV